MKKFSSSIFFSVFLGVLSGCAALHRVQISEIDNRDGMILEPFELKVSETGVDLGEAVRIQKALFKDSKAANQAGDIASFIALFQMGPRTGLPIYVEDYAANLVHAIYQQCPGGQVTGVMAIREMRKYPVISGEIVKIKGFCRRPKSNASLKVSSKGEI